MTFWRIRLIYLVIYLALYLTKSKRKIPQCRVWGQKKCTQVLYDTKLYDILPKNEKLASLEMADSKDFGRFLVVPEQFFSFLANSKTLGVLKTSESFISSSFYFFDKPVFDLWFLKIPKTILWKWKLNFRRSIFLNSKCQVIYL